MPQAIKLAFSKSVVPLAIVVSLALSLRSPQVLAESTEDRFQDLFITAGYATAFGAALGAAALSFTDEPEQHLKFVAVGASLGFMGGSALGTYLSFSPMFARIDDKKSMGLEARFSLALD